ncbi:hypothetical protein ACHAXT_006176 [Thalassiosira profunda]
MNFSNDHLVYPNLASAHIKPSNASTSASSLPPPPPAGSILTRMEESASKPSLQKYDFSVEKEVLAREKKRGDGDENGDADESVELDLAGVVDEKCSVGK